MASNYPTSIDSFTNPLSNSPLNSPSHAGQHQDLNAAVVAVETKLGKGASPASSATANQVLVANGSGSTSWAAVPEYSLQTGLVYITSGSWTNKTEVIVDGCFTATYDNYRVLAWDCTSGTANSLAWQFRSATPATLGNMDYAILYQNFNGGAFGNQSPAAGQAYVQVGYLGGGLSGFTADVFVPYTANVANMTFNAVMNDGMLMGSARCTNTVSKPGFRLSHVGAANMSGKYAVFGYRKA